MEKQILKKKVSQRQLARGGASFCRSAASQEIPRILEPECSLPYSQMPATSPYPEPTPTSLHSSLPLPEDPS